MRKGMLGAGLGDLMKVGRTRARNILGQDIENGASVDPDATNKQRRSRDSNATVQDGDQPQQKKGRKRKNNDTTGTTDATGATTTPKKRGRKKKADDGAGGDQAAPAVSFIAEAEGG